MRLNLSQDYAELSQTIKTYPQLLPDFSPIGPGKKKFVMGGQEILEIFEHAEEFFLFLAATKTIQSWAKNMQNILGLLKSNNSPFSPLTNTASLLFLSILTSLL